ncbi:hypothetical protein JW824_10125 [bacterium]|nr:hypothetical protein [bacterium]
MKSNNLNFHATHYMPFFLCLLVTFHTTNRSVLALEENKITLARKLFYQSVENEERLEEAFNLFEEIGENESLEGLALTYMGALTALKGKYAFLPITKYRHVQKGLQLMDDGIQKSPDNIEARFIRGMTCYYLPFFFNRKKTAREDFKIIVKQLNTECHYYDTELIMNVTNFLLENAELNQEEIEIIQNIQNQIAKDAG